MKKEICLVGLNYKTAPVEVREAFALSAPELKEQEIVPLNAQVRECLVLSTCNRVELLTVVKKRPSEEDPLEYILSCWAQTAGQPVAELRPYVYVHRDNAAVSHLFSVAASLDSMVLGEPQILGQLKDAYREALKNGTAKVIISRLLHKAFSVAKRVRTETGVASSAVSISYAAVELAKRIFDNMAEVRALLIGAGEMAELAATYLMNAGIASISVANRTFERAEELAARYNGTPIAFDKLIDCLAEHDIIISSTAAREPVILAKDLAPLLRKRKYRPMFFIDIAVPRDIEPAVNSLDNVYLYDIDDLKDVVEENLAHRRSEAVKAQSIVEEEAEAFARWVLSLRLQPTIVDLIDMNKEIARTELEKTLRRLGPVNDDVEAALTAMVSAMVKKMNHAPIDFLKRHNEDAETTLQNVSYVRRIFNLDNEMLPENAHPAGKICRRRKTLVPNKGFSQSSSQQTAQDTPCETTSLTPSPRKIAEK